MINIPSTLRWEYSEFEPYAIVSSWKHTAVYYEKTQTFGYTRDKKDIHDIRNEVRMITNCLPIINERLLSKSTFKIEIIDDDLLRVLFHKNINFRSNFNYTASIDAKSTNNDIQPKTESEKRSNIQNKQNDIDYCTQYEQSENPRDYN